MTQWFEYVWIYSFFKASGLTQEWTKNLGFNLDSLGFNLDLIHEIQLQNNPHDLGGGWTNPYGKIYAVVKLDHETPRIGVKIPKIFELPPPS